MIKLGTCERCGGIIVPVWCDGELSHGVCSVCGKVIVTEQITPRELRTRGFEEVL